MAESVLVFGRLSVGQVPNERRLIEFGGRELAWLVALRLVRQLKERLILRSNIELSPHPKRAAGAILEKNIVSVGRIGPIAESRSIPVKRLGRLIQMIINQYTS